MATRTKPISKTEALRRYKAAKDLTHFVSFYAFTKAPKEILNGMYTMALEGEIDFKEFVGASKFFEMYHMLVLEEMKNFRKHDKSFKNYFDEYDLYRRDDVNITVSKSAYDRSTIKELLKDNEDE